MERYKSELSKLAKELTLLKNMTLSLQLIAAVTIFVSLFFSQYRFGITFVTVVIYISLMFALSLRTKRIKTWIAGESKGIHKVFSSTRKSIQGMCSTLNHSQDNLTSDNLIYMSKLCGVILSSLGGYLTVDDVNVLTVKEIQTQFQTGAGLTKDQALVIALSLEKTRSSLADKISDMLLQTNNVLLAA